MLTSLCIASPCPSLCWLGRVYPGKKNTAFKIGAITWNFTLSFSTYSFEISLHTGFVLFLSYILSAWSPPKWINPVKTKFQKLELILLTAWLKSAHMCLLINSGQWKKMCLMPLYQKKKKKKLVDTFMATFTVTKWTWFRSRCQLALTVLWDLSISSICLWKNLANISLG